MSSRTRGHRSAPSTRSTLTVSKIWLFGADRAGDVRFRQGVGSRPLPESCRPPSAVTGGRSKELGTTYPQYGTGHLGCGHGHPLTGSHQQASIQAKQSAADHIRNFSDFDVEGESASSVPALLHPFAREPGFVVAERGVPDQFRCLLGFRGNGVDQGRVPGPTAPRPRPPGTHPSSDSSRRTAQQIWRTHSAEPVIHSIQNGQGAPARTSSLTWPRELRRRLGRPPAGMTCGIHLMVRRDPR